MLRRALLMSLCVPLVLLAATLMAGPARDLTRDVGPRRVAQLSAPDGKPFPEYIAARKPDLVLLGNSILDAAVDPNQLSQLCGVDCYKFVIHGSASALWYLMLRNAVLASEHQPKFVLIFFRDIFLTLADYRTGPNYRPSLNYFDPDHDPLLLDLVYDPADNAVEKLMRRRWSLYQTRDEVRERVEDWFQEGATSWLLGVDAEHTQAAVEAAFADDKMDQELLTRAQKRAGVPIEYYDDLDFGENVDRSFLPHTLRIAKEAGIQLIFVRAPVRRNTKESILGEGRAEFDLELIPRYMEQLAQYLEREGVLFLDLSALEELHMQHFAADDHLNLDRGQPVFTRILSERLRELSLWKAQ